MRVTRCDVNEVLKAGGRSGTASHTNTRLRSMLLIGEVALAMTLLVGTGLIVQSVHSLGNVNPGSAPANVLTMGVRLPLARYPMPWRASSFIRACWIRCRAFPDCKPQPSPAKSPMLGAEPLRH